MDARPATAHGELEHPAALSRRLAAEGLGSALLLATVVGSGLMGERLAGGAAQALLAAALATGAVLTVLITLLGPISGAHLNPAVTLVFAIRGEVGARAAAAYVPAQATGAVLGVWTAHLMFAEPLIQVSARLREGPPQLLSEGVATFGLVLTILGARRFRPEAVAAMVGLYIAAAYWFTASTSFANPAVTVARALSDTFAGVAPSSVPAFIAAQFGGAALAAALSGWLFETGGRPRR